MTDSQLDTLCALPAHPLIVNYGTHRRTCAACDINLDSDESKTNVITVVTYDLWIRQVKAILGQVKTANDCRTVEEFFPKGDGTPYLRWLREKWLGFTGTTLEVERFWFRLSVGGGLNHEDLTGWSNKIIARLVEISNNSEACYNARKFVTERLGDYPHMSSTQALLEHAARIWNEEAKPVFDQVVARDHLRYCPSDSLCVEQRDRLDDIAFPKEATKV